MPNDGIIVNLEVIYGTPSKTDKEKLQNGGYLGALDC